MRCVNRRLRWADAPRSHQDALRCDGCHRSHATRMNKLLESRSVNARPPNSQAEQSRHRLTACATISAPVRHGTRNRERSPAVPDISDIIQAIARQRGRGEGGPLIMLRELDASPGERISHLPVDGELAQAWVALTSEPFRPHQAQALTALRRGEPVALAAAARDIDLSGYLLLYAALLSEPHASALLLAPDMLLARDARDRLEQLNEALPQALRLTATLVASDRRPDQYARVVVTAPDALHGRLLRHHDRAWSLFWPRLQLVLLPDLHRYTGVAGAHLADLLLRLQRVATAHGGGPLLNILATMVACDDPAPALNTFLGQAWRVIAADDGPYETTTLAVWRGQAGRLRESTELATAIRKQGYHVHIACSAAESALLAPALGDVEGVTWGPIAPPAHV